MATERIESGLCAMTRTSGFGIDSSLCAMTYAFGVACYQKYSVQPTDLDLVSHLLVLKKRYIGSLTQALFRELWKR